MTGFTIYTPELHQLYPLSTVHSIKVTLPPFDGRPNVLPLYKFLKIHKSDLLKIDNCLIITHSPNRDTSMIILNHFYPGILKSIRNQLF